MPSPFPGMDPYLENPEIFPDFHDSFITYLREALQSRLPAPYFAVLGRRVWIAASKRSVGPDVQMLRPREPRQGSAQSSGARGVASRPATRPVVVKVAYDEYREPFVEIYADVEGNKRLVTSIEVLSLSNKTPGEHGRELFLRKQKELLASPVNLVEIDLLRGGEHATAVPRESVLAECGAFDYHVCVHAFGEIETFHVYPMVLEEPLATLEIPLLAGDPAVVLDLQAVFDRCYDAGPHFPRDRLRQDGSHPFTSARANSLAAWSAGRKQLKHPGRRPLKPITAALFAALRDGTIKLPRVAGPASWSGP